MIPLCFPGLKGNHWLGMSQSQTPMQSHTSPTQCPPPRAAAHQAAQHKIAKYSKLASTHMFYPIAIETASTWDDMAIELVQEIGRRTTVITHGTRETVFLFQRLSIALQRGNVVSFQPLFNILLSFHVRGFVLVGKKIIIQQIGQQGTATTVHLTAIARRQHSNMSADSRSVTIIGFLAVKC